MRDLSLRETLQAKVAFEKINARAGRTVKHYQADNGRFADNAFLDACNDNNQTITYCGVGAHHQNGIIENKNKQLTQIARTLLLHGMRMWPQMIDSMFWPFAIKAAAERMNSLNVNLDGTTPESIFYGVPIENIPVKSFHTLFCPCYVLDSGLHNAGGIGPPKWEPRSHIRVYLGHSPFHAGNVALVFNPSTGHVSPQYHVVFDDDFTTVQYMNEGAVPPNWADLVHHSSELATKESFVLTENWLKGCKENTDLQAPDNPVVDPYAVVTDHHISNERSRQREQNTNPPTKQSSTTTTLPKQLAVSEGEGLTLGRKRSFISAEDNVVTGAQDAHIKGHAGNAAAAISDQSTPHTVDELKLPPRINLRESGLRRSERIKALNETKTTPEHTPNHVRYGARPLKNSIIGLFTLFSFVNNMSVPHHQIESDAPMKDKMIAKFEEINELFDGTLNHFHMLAFSTDISSNEVFTYKEAMQEEDKLNFVKAMEKEIEDHESRDHWSIVERSSVPDTAKPIRAIWSFKRKRRPDGTLLKHKARICAHGGMQTWGTNYWETYSPVVNMITVCLILLIARIYNLDSKAIDFVLAFPQADLDVDIWMYLPSGFQVDGKTEAESSRKYILKLHKSLYGLKQASFNWYEKLKDGLTVRGFTQSQIDPCLYLKKGMLIITYVDDCIIVGNSMLDINTFVESMKNGSEGFILTDEGNINKFLGIEIK